MKNKQSLIKARTRTFRSLNSVHLKNLQIIVSEETKDQVINGLKEFRSSIKTEPIIGLRKGKPGKVYLIYQAVEKAPEIALKARGLGAKVVEKF